MTLKEEIVSGLKELKEAFKKPKALSFLPIKKSVEKKKPEYFKKYSRHQG